jgi:hypothetical protein
MRILEIIKEHKYIVLAAVMVLICIGVSVVENTVGIFNTDPAEVVASIKANPDKTDPTEVDPGVESEAINTLKAELINNLWQTKEGKLLVFGTNQIKEYQGLTLIATHKFTLREIESISEENNHAWVVSAAVDGDKTFVSIEKEANGGEMLVRIGSGEQYVAIGEAL